MVSSARSVAVPYYLAALKAEVQRRCRTIDLLDIAVLGARQPLRVIHGLSGAGSQAAAPSAMDAPRRGDPAEPTGPPGGRRLRGSVTSGPRVGWRGRGMIVMSDRGLWLGVVTCELERRGMPVMTASALACRVPDGRKVSVWRSGNVSACPARRDL
jgi:hypothetical protein